MTCSENAVKDRQRLHQIVLIRLRAVLTKDKKKTQAGSRNRYISEINDDIIYCSLCYKVIPVPLNILQRSTESVFKNHQAFLI